MAGGVGDRGRHRRSSSLVAEAGRGVDRRAVRRRCGCCRRSSPAGSACRRRVGRPSSSRTTTSRRCASSPVAPGGSSRRSSAPRTTGCRPTTSRTTRSRSSPIAPRRPTSGCTCSRRSTARDFGWIGTLDMVERLEATLATIGRLERFRGHLYNWYDTRDLQPARARVRVVGRQRQPRRPPARRCPTPVAR